MSSPAGGSKIRPLAETDADELVILSWERPGAPAAILHTFNHQADILASVLQAAMNSGGMSTCEGDETDDRIAQYRVLPSGVIVLVWLVRRGQEQIRRCRRREAKDGAAFLAAPARHRETRKRPPRRWWQKRGNLI